MVDDANATPVNIYFEPGHGVKLDSSISVVSAVKQYPQPPRLTEWIQS